MFNAKYVEIHNYNSTHVSIQAWCYLDAQDPMTILKE